MHTNESTSIMIATNNTNKRRRTTFPFDHCKVCNDKATGFHYGVETCEGCKGFFKRSILKNEVYKCSYDNRCELKPENRNRCKACRFRICSEVGMSMDSVKMGRIPKELRNKLIKNRTSNNTISNFITKSLTNCIETININDNSLLSSNWIVNLANNCSNKSILMAQKTHDKEELVVDLTKEEEDKDDSNDLELITSFGNNNLNVNNLTLQILGDFMVKTHNDDMSNIRVLMNRAQNLIKFNVKEFNGHDSDIKTIWSCLIESIQDHVKCLIKLSRNLPGFNELSQDDYFKFIDTRLFDYFMLKNVKLLINNEFYFVFNNGIQYTRRHMTNAIGIQMTNGIFKFFNDFNSLNLTDKEYSLLLPFLLTSLNHLSGCIHDKDKLIKLHEMFGRILYFELINNKRDKLFVKKLIDICYQLPALHKLEKEQVRTMIPITQ